MRQALVILGTLLFTVFAVLVIELFHTTDTYYWAFQTPDWHGSWLFYHMIDLQIRIGIVLFLTLGLPGMLILAATEHPATAKRIMYRILNRQH